MEYFWHQAPLLRIAIFFIAGIVFGFYLPPLALFRIGTGVILLLLISGYFIFRKRWKYYRNRYWVGILVNIGFLLAGIFLSIGKNEMLVSEMTLPPKADYYGSELLDFPHSGENSVRLDLSIRSYETHGEGITCPPTRVFAYTAPDLALDTLKPGDLVFFRATLLSKREVLNPGQFDYSHYLHNKGIATTVYLDRNVIARRPVCPSFRFSITLKKIQNYFVGVFSAFNIPDRELGVASALILGKRNLIDPNLKSEYSEVGAVHILAVSGLHVGIIYIVIITLLGRIFKARKWRLLIFLISLVFLWAYAGITGFSPSVLRATVMFSFIALGHVYGKVSNIYNMLAASAIALLVYNPSIVKEVGFQLSYLAVLGISYFYKQLYQLRIFKYWLPDKIWSLLIVAVAAQISTFPLSVYYFGQFPNYFLPTNILVIPTAMIALYSGLLLLVFHWIPILGIGFAWVLRWDIWILNTFIEWTASLPMAVSDHLHLSAIAVVLLYVFIIGGANLLQYPSRRNLITTFGIFITLIAMWNYRKMEIANRVGLSVLKGYRGDAVCMQKGNMAYVFLTDTTKKVLEKNRFYLDGYFDQKGIESEVWIAFNTDFHLNGISGKNGFFSFDSCRFSVLNRPEDIDLANKLSCDFVLLQKGMEIPESGFENENMVYILSSNLPSYSKKRIIGELEKSGIPYWDMQSDGMYSPPF